MQAQSPEYNGTAKILHWLIALVLVVMLVLGWLMTAGDILDGHGKSVAMQAHISIGMIVLTLGLLRLVWRLLNPPPQLPAFMPRWEKVAAQAVHWILYSLILIMPLVGWMIISTMSHNALFFGLFPIPNLPVLHDLPNKKDIREVLENIHWLLAWVIVAFVGLHAGAAMKHHFIERDDILLRMTPRLFGRILHRLRGSA